METREVLFFQYILHDFPLVNGRLTHLLKVTCDGVPKLPSKSYELCLSKLDSLYIRHLISIKVILHSNQPVRKRGGIYLLITRGHIYFHLSSNIIVTVTPPAFQFLICY